MTLQLQWGCQIIVSETERRYHCTKSMAIAPFWFLANNTVEPRYNEVLGTMKITMFYQVSCYIRVKNKEI